MGAAQQRFENKWYEIIRVAEFTHRKLMWKNQKYSSN